MPHEESYIGVGDDLRPQAERQRDWTAEEVYGVAPVVWRKKKAPLGDEQFLLNNKFWRKFGVRDQFGNSCVAHTNAKALGVGNFNEEGVFLLESAHPIYADRPGNPSPGMSGIDGLKHAAKKGTTSEARLPSIKKRDEVLNAPYPWAPEDVAHAEKYRAGGFVTLFDVTTPGSTFSIDAVAAAIETLGVGLSCHIFSTGAEWQHLVPYIGSPNLTWQDATVRHSLLVVDYTLYEKNGKWVKALVCDDSYANDDKNRGQRILTEEFLAKRCRFLAHGLPKPNGAAPAVPKPVLTRDLKWLDRGSDVRQLQAYLQAKGFMTTVWTDGSPLAPTGLWKSATAQAVRRWQVTKGLLDFVGKPDDQVRFGAKSRLSLANE